MLFIASGAFHSVKPSDLLPELQGRLPIRVQLNALTEKDMRRILTETESNLIMQQIALIGTEGVTLRFNDDAVAEIAHMAAEMNLTVENIGARRLQTVMERLVEDISFDAADMEPGSEVRGCDTCGPVPVVWAGSSRTWRRLPCDPLPACVATVARVRLGLRRSSLTWSWFVSVWARC